MEDLEARQRGRLARWPTTTDEPVFKSWARLLARTAILLAALIGLGIVAVGVGELIPDRWVAAHLVDARQDGTLTNTAQEKTRVGGIADHFTECVSISVGLGHGSDSFLESMAGSPNLGPCDRLVAAVDEFSQTDRLPEGGRYLRYWHGTSSIFRIVIAVGGLAVLRVLAFAAVVGSVLLVARQVRQVAGVPAAVAIVGPFVATTDFIVLSGTVHHSMTLAVAFAGAALVATAAFRTGGVWFSAVLAGAAFVYVDLLTNVPGAWALVTAMAIFAARTRTADPAVVARTGIAAGVGWIVGYAGMWAGKWAFAASVLGYDVVRSDVTDSVRERVNGDSPWSEDRFGAAIDANVDAWFEIPFTRVVLLLSVLVLAKAIWSRLRNRTVRSDSIAGVLIAIVPALLPFVWFEFASNHSQVHAWFTYRSIPLALGIGMLALLTPEPKPRRAAESAPVA
ncbi:MAG: hypothetical protein ACI9C1_003271 [Candidatus Aldehydirespiratoraceae bacterium]|jgi:hypothetical protein